MARCAARFARIAVALPALGERDFRLLSIGQTISVVGTQMQWVAQGWLVLQLTGSPVAVSIVVAAQIGPMQLLALGGGLIGDVLPRRATLLGTQTLLALQGLLLGLLVASGREEAWHIYAMALVLGVVQAIDYPVRDAFVADVVPRRLLHNAVAVDRAITFGGRALGPAIGGLLMVTTGVASVFLLNAATYLAEVAALAAVRDRPRPGGYGAAAGRSALRRPGPALGEGLGYVRSSTEIAMTLAVIGIIGAFGINFSGLLPILARDVLLVGAGGYGLLMSANGIGSLIGGITWAVRPTSFRLILVAGGIVGAAGLAVAWSRWFPLTLVAMAVAGWTLITMATAASTLIQTRVPDRLRARVMALYTIVFVGPSPVGAMLAGGLAQAAGVVVALTAAGVVSLATALAATMIYLRSGSAWQATSDRAMAAATAAVPTAELDGGHEPA